MRAARALGEGRIEIVDLPVGEPGDDELLIRTHCAAICGSDLHRVFGPRLDGPAGFGHESVGTVERSRSARVPEGTLVLVAPPPVISHAFAEFQVVPARFVVPLPDGADPRLMVMAQQLGTAIFAMKRFWPASPVRVAAVIGCGSAGLNFVQLLRRRGVEEIVAADRRPWRTELAGRVGATATVLADERDIVDEVLTRTRGAGADLVVEASGTNAGRRQAMLAVGTGGRVGFFGLPEMGAPDTAMPYAQIFAKAPDLVIAAGAQHEPGMASFREAVELVGTRRLEAEELISHEFPLDRLDEAFRLAHDVTDGVVKATITIDGN